MPSATIAGPSRAKEPLLRPRIRLWWFAFAALAALLSLPIYALSRAFRIDPEKRAIRSTVLETVIPGAEWHRQIEVNIGPVVLGLARLITPLLEVDEDAREALGVLSAIDDVQVSVFQARGWSAASADASVLTNITAAMDDRSWQRVVAVQSANDSVAVFISGDLGHVGAFDVCVFAFSEGTLVMAASHADFEALAPLISDLTSKYCFD